MEVVGAIAHHQVDAAVALHAEEVPILALPSTGIEHPCACRNLSGKPRNRILDGAFEVKDVTPQKLRETFRNGAISHQARLRSSIMSVGPASNAPASMRNGNGAKMVFETGKVRNYNVVL